MTDASTTALTDLMREYAARTPASRAHHDRLSAHLPGGETRSVAFYPPYPAAIAGGQRAMLTDLDGNEYIDVLNNYTSLVHGHAFTPVVAAAAASLPSGTVFPAPHDTQLELAQILTTRYPAVERVRFTNSGTEATLLASRLVRRVTGRQRLVIFAGGYHGGIPEFLDGGPDTTVVPYNDTEQAVRVIDSTVAAVFAEPFLGSAGVIVAGPEFLRQVAGAARAAGALFVLDEVQALRNAPHGTHASLGLDPDLILMGKIIGGGFPVGAVGGRSSILDLTSAARAGGISCSGTFNGNVISMAAGAACLRALDEPAITALNDRAMTLAAQIQAAAGRVGWPVTVTRAGSILNVHVGELAASTGTPAGPSAAVAPPAPAPGLSAAQSRHLAALHLALLLEGVYTAPRGMLNLSTALDDTQLAAVAARYEQAFSRISRIISGSALAQASR